MGCLFIELVCYLPTVACLLQNVSDTAHLRKLPRRMEKMALSPLSQVKFNPSQIFNIYSLSRRKGSHKRNSKWFYVTFLPFTLKLAWCEHKIIFTLSPGVVACSCNPATRRQVWGMAWGREPCWSSGHVDPASALRLASTWAPPRSRRGSGCLMRGEPGQGLKPAAKSPRGGQ